MIQILKNLYKAFKLKKAYNSYLNELTARAAGTKALYRANIYCAVQDIVLDDLVILTSLPPEDIVQLQCETGLTLYQIRRFYVALGFLPTVGFAIGIRHIGLEEVINCIEKIPRGHDIR